jgi:hypothetical protein
VQKKLNQLRIEVGDCLRNSDQVTVLGTDAFVVHAGRVENTGQTWNERRTDADVWGTAPTRIETIKGNILLKNLEGAVVMGLGRVFS